MIECGTTITWEAWDQHYKPNQDWNHAWGAAPTNLLPTYVLGVSPRVPGWSEIEIRPATGALAWCEGRVPTPRGPVEVRCDRKPFFRLKVSLPEGVNAHVTIPAGDGTGRVLVNGQPVSARRESGSWSIEPSISGNAVVELH